MLISSSLQSASRSMAWKCEGLALQVMEVEGRRMKRKRFLGLDSLVFIIKVYVYQYDRSTYMYSSQIFLLSLFLVGCLFGRIPAFCSRILSAATPPRPHTLLSHHSTTMTKRPSFCVAKHRLPVAMALNDALSYILFIFAYKIVRRFGTNNTKHIIIMLAQRTADCSSCLRTRTTSSVPTDTQ